MESLADGGARIAMSFGARGSCPRGGGRRLVEACGAMLMWSRGAAELGGEVRT